MSARGPALVTAAAVGLVALSRNESVPTLLTVPQRDRLRSTLTPASASIAAGGRFIAFSSYDRLTPDDTDERADIYVLDRSTGIVTLHSVRTDGIEIDSDCGHPRISGSGRYLVFEASTLKSDSADAGSQVVLHDRETGIARTLSRVRGAAPNGWSGRASIADDGLAIAYASTATDLVPGADANGLQADVYLWRVATGQLERASLDSRGRQPARGSSFDPSLSGDGRYLAFTSTANLDERIEPPRVGTAARAPLTRVYLRDVRAGVTTAVAPRGRQPDGSSMTASISRDGRFVAFASHASNLVPNDRNRSPDVFLFDRETGSITLVSRNGAGRPANGTSSNPAISGDGRVVAFQSDAADLSCGSRCGDAHDINLLSDVFLFDRSTGHVTHVSGSGSTPWMEESAAPAVDDDGDTIAFSSRHPIDRADVGHDFDLFVRVSR